MKNLSQDSQSPGLNLNWGPSQYETGVLITQSWHSEKKEKKTVKIIKPVYAFNINAFISSFQSYHISSLCEKNIYIGKPETFFHQFR